MRLSLQQAWNIIERAGKRPAIMITDGLPSYHEAFNKEYYTNKKDSIYINTIQLTGEHNNNLVERANGEFRDREKCTRGLKTNDSPMIQGYEVYHNFIKPHIGPQRKDTSRHGRNRNPRR